MRQYQIIYHDKATEYVLAYSYTRHGRMVIFDIGKHRTLTRSGVEAVLTL